jgi:ABC-type branched-subunit amino acid transport system ATPase component
MAKLSVKGLDKRFDGLAAIENLDLELEDGIITALVGPNGAGKTTLFNLITGNLVPDGGRVDFEGRSILGLPPYLVARLGIARSFQDLRLFNHMTVRENVATVPEQRAWLWQAGGANARRARQQSETLALQRTGLAPHAQSRAVDLSYAERKFLSLARIMASGAKIWLLDEPASGLDPVSRSRFTEVLKKAAVEGTTVCLIEHNLDIVTELADRIVFLDRGRKLADGSPSEILSNPELAEVYFGRRRT